jgi:hypothetical protein
VNGNASDAAELAAQLCDAYTSYYERMMQVCMSMCHTSGVVGKLSSSSSSCYPIKP